MGSAHESISAEMVAFIAAQHMFFVATAPDGAAGHVNLSPKGLNTFTVISPEKVAYLDLTGSGNETAAHVTQNGRITFMFCAFSGKPMILRLFGRGRVVLPGEGDWDGLRGRFPEMPGVRQVITADLTRVQTSCGFGVPRMMFTDERQDLTEWCQRRSAEELADYRRRKNRVSIDGIPAPGP